MSLSKNNWEDVARSLKFPNLNDAATPPGFAEEKSLLSKVSLFSKGVRALDFPQPQLYGTPDEPNNQWSKADNLNNENNLNPQKKKLKYWIKKAKEKAESVIRRTEDRVESTRAAYINVKYAIIAGAVGFFCILLSLLFLPTAIFNPRKFSLCFTIGCLLIINGCGLLRGYTELFHHLMSKERIGYSICYLISIILTLYFTLIYRSYIFTIIFAALQFFFLVIVLLSYISGGSHIINYLTNTPLDRIKKLFKRDQSLPI